jgi:hypothetical protein
MRDLVIKILTEESKKLLNESGIRDIRALAKRYPMAKIYFHMDLDGVTTALAMKNYLEQHGIKVVDAELIQYGAKEFAVKKPEGEGDIMPVLVDFAHGKPMFVIHTDHHDTQAGVEKGTSTNFKPSRSNVETISQTISPKDIFTPGDIETISMIDSADYAKYDITPDDVIKYIFKFDKDKSLRENKRLMGLVANKLLLAFKNKPNFLRDIVMKAQPSLLSILTFILDEIKTKGYASIEDMVANTEKYIESRKEDKNLSYSDGVISQYGLGSMKAGSYDRYVPFKNFPDAEFLVTGLPLGIVQASCNPYRKERALKGIDLGQVKNEVLDNFKDELSSQKLTFGDLKRLSEQEAEYQSVGFTFKDMLAIYGDRPSFKMEGGEKTKQMLQDISTKLYRTLSQKQKEMLNKASVNGFDVIEANSGGHKCITNITGINYIYRTRKNDNTDNIDSELLPIAKYEGENKFVNDIKGKLLRFGSLSPKQIEVALSQINKETGGVEPTEKPRKTFVDLIKEIQEEFVRILKEKIQKSKEQPQLEMNESVIRLKKSDIINNKIKFRR